MDGRGSNYKEKGGRSCDNGRTGKDIDQEVEEPFKRGREWARGGGQTGKEVEEYLKRDRMLVRNERPTGKEEGEWVQFLLVKFNFIHLSWENPLCLTVIPLLSSFPISFPNL